MSREETGFKRDANFWSVLLRDFDSCAIDGFATGANNVRWKAILLFGRSDLEVNANVWQLPNYSQGDEICKDCLCNRTDRPFTDLREEAAWRGTEDMLEDGVMLRYISSKHPLVRSHYFSSHFARLDMMHILDCKGVVATFAGSILLSLATSNPLLGSTHDARCAELTRLRLEFECDNNVQNRLAESRYHLYTNALLLLASMWRHNCCIGAPFKAVSGSVLCPSRTDVGASENDDVGASEKEWIDFASIRFGFWLP